MQRMKRASFAALFALLSIAGSAAAQQALSPGGKSTAQQIIEITGQAAAAENAIVQIMAPLERLLRQAFPSVPDALWTDAFVEIKSELKNGLPDFMAGVARSMERHYTQEELEEILRFHQSPVGQKSIRLAPVLAQENSAVGRLWGEQVGRRAFENAAERLKAKGYQPKQL